MAYRYRVTLLHLSRHREARRKRMFLLVQDLETGVRRLRWLGPHQMLLHEMYAELPAMQTPLPSDASLVVRAPGRAPWSPHPCAVLIDIRLQVFGAPEYSELGPLQIGESFLLWTRDAPGIPDPPAGGP